MEDLSKFLDSLKGREFVIVPVNVNTSVQKFVANRPLLARYINAFGANGTTYLEVLQIDVSDQDWDTAQHAFHNLNSIQRIVMRQESPADTVKVTKVA